MNPFQPIFVSASYVFLGTLLAVVASTASAQDTLKKEARETTGATEKRKAWTSSRVVGRPEPPAPLREELAYPEIRFQNPVVMIGAPGSDRWFVGEQSGKVYSFSKDRKASQRDLFLDITTQFPPAKIPGLNVDNSMIIGLEAFYGLTFHPQFESNRFVYVCYVIRLAQDKLPPGQTQFADGTRVSRFKVTDTNPPRAIPESEEIIITWLQGGHNGGCLAFGPDGYLYISTGDGGFANPPDGRNSGQDVSNLLSAVLRIDVDHPNPDQKRAYSIPDDNPFVGLEGARGEIWCYGLRNPWKMKFDRETGDLWVGDVGWELWELVYQVEKGANYGWSVVEGRQSVYPERKIGPTPIVPPTIEIPHTDGVSITGGYVYRGKKFPELVGSYIWGDWETRRIWASQWDDVSRAMTPMKDVVDSNVRLVDFAEDDDGELFLLDYDNGTIHELFRTPAATANEKFPIRLSETGLFESVPDQIPAPGVIPFDINAQQWADHASARRFVGVPGDESIQLHSAQQQIAGSMFQSSMKFPNQTVLAKTLTMEMTVGDPKTSRNIETQLLHYDGRFWRGYTYAWNDEQTDAELVENHGREITLNVDDVSAPGGRREQTWHFPSRVECVRCHNQWAEYALAFNLRQLNRETKMNGVSRSQLDHFEQIGLVDIHGSKSPTSPAKTQTPTVSELPKLVDPHDVDADKDRRARSWLHVNCAHCHRIGGGGSAEIELREELPIEGLKVVDVRPTQGNFEIPDGRIITAGNPFRSTLFYRISKNGSGRMPHIGSEIVDEAGVDLIQNWIRNLPVQFDATILVTRLNELDENLVARQEDDNAESRLTQLAQEEADRRRAEELKAAGQTTVPAEPAKISDVDREIAKRRDEKQALERKKRRAIDREATLASLLGSTSNAIVLARALQHDQLHPGVREFVIETTTARPEPQLRDLFEQFVPANRRIKRMGSTIRPEKLLALKGVAEQGRQLFTTTVGITCRNCHRIGDVGSKLGPELTLIARKNSRAQILDSILEPSKVIDPKFISYVITTLGGKIHTGLLVDRNVSEVVLRNAKDEVVRIAAKDIDEISPQRQSLMPELLLKDMTAEQVADLIEYLATLK